MVTHLQPRKTIRMAPGPRVTPFNAVHYLRWDLIEMMETLWQQYGDIVHLKAPGQPIFFIANPEYAYEMLIENPKAFGKMKNAEGMQDGLGLVFGKGLLTNLDHDSWLSQRRMMQPIFHRRYISRMGDAMVQAGEYMIERWRARYQAGDMFDLFPEMNLLTLDVVGRTMFTMEVAEIGERIGPSIEVAASFAYMRERTPVRFPMSWAMPRHIKFHQAMNRIDSLIYDVIRERRASGIDNGDLLSMMLAARDQDTGEGMDDKQLRDETVTVFGAGHDTTANALTWTWYLLSQYPDVLKKLQNEVDTVLEGRSPTMADLQNLPYTLQVFEESMRLYPPSPLVPREAMEDTTISDYYVPDGAKTLINIVSIHRHPDYWHEPDKFIPERFDPDVREKRHRFAYMPFGGGPRQCIGNTFALTEGHLLLALMAQHVVLDVVPGQQVKREIIITMRPRNGLKVYYRPR